uniref:AAA+ ATPase domain-containing protein n=1 Tax=viral metagenome TaxID=1070528 RepID=A0A6C0E912_9ZZZZ
MSRENLPWIEKYRPHMVEDISMEPLLKRIIENILKTNEMPNIMLTGNPGVGKTTTILCIANKLYGKYYKSAVLEVNASDDRGIKSVQNDLTDFCNLKLAYSKEDEKKYAKHKLIILDEADNITEKAQNLISVMMEKYYDKVRFAFTCNKSTDIIESIQSKCKILRYPRLKHEFVVDRLKYIVKKEKVNYEKTALEQIACLSIGDMRNAINLLQLVYNKHDDVSLKNVNSVCDLPQPDLLNEILKLTIEKKFRDAFTKIINIKNNGFSGLDILKSILMILKMPITKNITEEQRLKIFEITSQHYFDISKSIDSNMHLGAYISDLCTK